MDQPGRALDTFLEHARTAGVLDTESRHPENLGQNPSQKLAFLRRVLKHFSQLRAEHGMESLAMAEVAPTDSAPRSEGTSNRDVLALVANVPARPRSNRSRALAATYYAEGHEARNPEYLRPTAEALLLLRNAVRFSRERRRPVAARHFGCNQLRVTSVHTLERAAFECHLPRVIRWEKLLTPRVKFSCIVSSLA